LTAHFYCWEPGLDIRPERSDFGHRLSEAQGQSGTSAKLSDFVAALLAKYPDLSTTDETPWATGPLDGEICGNFINFAVSSSWYDDGLISFVVATARTHGLHCFDPQSKKFYEAVSTQ